MVGDANLQIYVEQYSYFNFPSLVETVWTRANEMGATAFIPDVGSQVYDDHIPLMEANIPAIDIIDFDYPYWHTLEDSPDKCSPESLQQVGKLLVSLLYNPPKYIDFRGTEPSLGPFSD